MFNKLKLPIYLFIILHSLALSADEDKWDPYQYREKNEKSRKYFSQLLPSHLVKSLEGRFKFNYLTACTTDFDGDGRSDQIVGMVLPDKKTASVIGFSTKNKSSTKEYPLDLVAAGISLSESGDDYIETYCETGAYIPQSSLNNLSVKPNKTDKIILIKSYEANGLNIYLFDKKEQKFKSIGGIDPG